MRIAVLGMGAMGSRMALALLKAGHTVTVWNRTTGRLPGLTAAGAKAASTPRAAVADAELAIVMVRDDAASRQVWLDPETGALAGLADGAIGIDSSTLSVAGVRALGQAFEAAVRAFLDAPVSGSRPQADAGQLIYYVGGRPEVLARAEPVLRAMGVAVHHAGAVGDGAALKLAVNALFGIQVAALAETLGVLAQRGIDLTQAVAILGETPVLSPAAKGAAASMLSGAFAPQFPVDLVEKDFGYALATGGPAAPDAPLTQAARAVFARAIQQGFGDDNLTGVVRLYR